MIEAQVGDFILAHRKGFISACIRWGERLRFNSGARWSHAAFVAVPEDSEGHGRVIEALSRGVASTPLRVYENIEHIVVRSNMDDVLDRAQAVHFAQSCVGQEYGWAAIIGTALRFFTPGRGLWFGMNGTEICSGLVGETQVRGWKVYKVNPASLTPAELAEEHNVKVQP